MTDPTDMRVVLTVAEVVTIVTALKVARDAQAVTPETASSVEAKLDKALGL